MESSTHWVDTTRVHGEKGSILSVRVSRIAVLGRAEALAYSVSSFFTVRRARICIARGATRRESRTFTQRLFREYLPQSFLDTTVC